MFGAAFDEEFSEVGGEADPSRPHSIIMLPGVAPVHKLRIRPEIVAERRVLEFQLERQTKTLQLKCKYL